MPATKLGQVGCCPGTGGGGTCTYTIEVTDCANGSPITGATVSISGTSGPTYSGTTNDSGVFTVADVTALPGAMVTVCYGGCCYTGPVFCGLTALCYCTATVTVNTTVGTISVVYSWPGTVDGSVYSYCYIGPVGGQGLPIYVTFYATADGYLTACETVEVLCDSNITVDLSPTYYADCYFYAYFDFGPVGGGISGCCGDYVCKSPDPLLAGAGLLPLTIQARFETDPDVSPPPTIVDFQELENDWFTLPLTSVITEGGIFIVWSTTSGGGGNYFWHCPDEDPGAVAINGANPGLADCVKVFYDSTIQSVSINFSSFSEPSTPGIAASWTFVSDSIPLATVTVSTSTTNALALCDITGVPGQPEFRMLALAGELDPWYAYVREAPCGYYGADFATAETRKLLLSLTPKRTEDSGLGTFRPQSSVLSSQSFVSAQPSIDPAVRDAVNACPERGSEGGLVLTDRERSCCGGGPELTACGLGRGKSPGRVTLRDCLACQSIPTIAMHVDVADDSLDHGLYRSCKLSRPTPGEMAGLQLGSDEWVSFERFTDPDGATWRHVLSANKVAYLLSRIFEPTPTEPAYRDAILWAWPAPLPPSRPARLEGGQGWPGGDPASRITIHF